MQALTTYVLTAILAWTHPHAKDLDVDRLTGIAQDIAAVSLAEKPLFEGDASRSKTVLLLASVARYESNFAEWVDDGRCNDKAWLASHMAMHRGSNCDSGNAFSLWQVHAGATGPLMIEDRQVAIREAMKRLRKSLQDGRGLCGYTGEVGDCPKAELRLRTALVWELGHPFKVDS